MCSECMDEEPECNFCGTFCEGQCSDPDSCRSCWSEWNDVFTDDGWDECMDEFCPCTCHVAMQEETSMKWNHGSHTWVDIPEPYEHKGVFQFMHLAGEVRDKIYHYALLQRGTFRTSVNFRGRIDTSILYTCRQINKEARHLPLTINDLWFTSPVQAMNFFGFLLQPTQRNLVTSFHLDLHSFPDIYGLPLQLLIKQLAKTPITSLGLTLMGRINKEWFIGHTCFVSRLKPLKNLKHFKLVIGSGIIDEKDKAKIIKSMTKELTAHNNKKVSKKRKASDSATSSSVDKPQKRPSASTRLAARLEECQAEALFRKALVGKYYLLEEYAQALDFAAVEIRLKQAREAAEGGNKKEFAKLVKSILRTLEEKFAKVSVARAVMPVRTA